MTYTDTELPQEDFEGLKTALRLAGYIPNKKLNREMWPKLNAELDNIKLGQVDELSFEDVLRLEDEKRENRRRRHFFNTIEDELRPYVRRYIR